MAMYSFNQLEKLEAAKASLSCLPSLPLLTGLYWILLGLTVPYWALLGLTGPYLALIIGLTLHLSTDPRTHGRTYITTYWAAFAAKNDNISVLHRISAPCLKLQWIKNK